jgi:hypothetical protein
MYWGVAIIGWLEITFVVNYQDLFKTEKSDQILVTKKKKYQEFKFFKIFYLKKNLIKYLNLMFYTNMEQMIDK